MRPRSLGRRLALQYLFMHDVAGPDRVEPPAAFLAEHTDSDDARSFAAHLINLTLGARERIDLLLQKALENWTLNRIAAVERTALRIGCAELLEGASPPKVILDEAVRLAKRFGGKESGPFVNGVLDRVCKTLEIPSS